jgi:hypothetical protein
MLIYSRARAKSEPFAYDAKEQPAAAVFSTARASVGISTSAPRKNGRSAVYPGGQRVANRPISTPKNFLSQPAAFPMDRNNETETARDITRDSIETPSETVPPLPPPPPKVPPASPSDDNFDPFAPENLRLDPSYLNEPVAKKLLVHCNAWI